MKKRKLCFFLDYGTCLWGANAEEHLLGGLSFQALPLTDETRHQVKLFLREYDSSYNYGCPPNDAHTIEFCKRFNREYRRILDLIVPELGSQFIICIDQLDLTEDANVLAELDLRGSEYYRERQAMYEPEDGDYTNFAP